MGPDTILRHAHRHVVRSDGEESNSGRIYPHIWKSCLDAGGAFEFRRLTATPRPTVMQALGDKRMTAVLLLSFASGLPFNLTGFTLQAWLASAGLDIKTIGIFGLVGFPYILKFLWAPLLDRYLPPLLGRRRGWILVYQACLAICIGVMGFCSPSKEPYVLGAVAMMV